MSRRVRPVVDYFDDWNGEFVPEAEVQTFQFTWNGVHYETDLGPANAESLAAFMENLTTKAQRVGGRKLPAKRSQKEMDRDTHQERRELPPGQTRYQAELARRELLKEVRQWAIDRGMPQSPQGRIGQAVRDAWDEAFPDRKLPDEGLKNFVETAQ